MRRRVGAVVCVGMLALGGLASCGSSDDTLTRDEFIDQMTSGDDAIPVEAATCIADGVEAQGIEIGQDGNPAQDDEDEATQIAIDCFAAQNGVDPAQIPGSDSSSTTAAP